MDMAVAANQMAMRSFTGRQEWLFRYIIREPTTIPRSLPVPAGVGLSHRIKRATQREVARDAK